MNNQNCIVRNITKVEYTGLDISFQALNREFFDNQLPESLINLHRHKGAKGYFKPDSIQARGREEIISEIALNPDTFESRTDEEIISTLLHEMTHSWQHLYGNPSRAGYHNAEFAKKMDEHGLITSSTGEPGGAKTGQKMTHYIKIGGRFELFVKKLINEGIKINWQSKPTDSKKVKSRDKIKYTCPECNSNVWGKPGLRIICSDCDQEFQEGK